jgi:hypothetical protein
LSAAEQRRWEFACQVDRNGCHFVNIFRGEALGGGVGAGGEIDSVSQAL